MNSKIFYKVSLVLFLVTFMVHDSVYANQWEDQDTPISFKIEILPWAEADEVIPNKSIFTIVDVETGLSFRAQRRAGSQHADVQPLTKKDTVIMKKIYNNTWSWKRRAILIVVNDQLIAASMHGMPHGAGALPNGFPGHFCVHFSGSITHRLKNEDFSHKLMILKAAGKMDEYVSTANPYELIRIFTTAINQGDPTLLQLSLSPSDHSTHFKKVVNDITHLGIDDFSSEALEDSNELLLTEISVRAEIYTKKKGKEKKFIHFMIRRNSLMDRWFIDQDSLYKDFK